MLEPLKDGDGGGEWSAMEAGVHHGDDALLDVLGGAQGFQQRMREQRKRMLINTGIGLAAAGICTAVLYAFSAGVINSLRDNALDGHSTGKWVLLGFLSGVISYAPVRIATVQMYSSEDKQNMVEFFATPAVNLPLSALMLLVAEQSFSAAGDALAVSALGNGSPVLLGAITLGIVKAYKEWRNNRPALVVEPVDQGFGYSGLPDVVTYDLNAFVAGDVGTQQSQYPNAVSL